MNETSKNIFIFAGEPSGDLHGSHLLKALKTELPEYVFRGVGGPLMRLESLYCIFHMEDFSVMGFTDVLRHFPRLWKQFYQIRDDILKTQPTAVVFIDYPGFNLRMAKALRKKGYKGKLIHYICPSVWAWGKNRIEKMRSTLDLLLTIYPFEAAYFAHTDLPVKYVGNPLQEAIQNHAYQTDIHFPENLVAIFPGSREGEIRRNFPKMAAAAALLKQQYPEINLALSWANEQFFPFIHETLAKYQLDVMLVPKSHSYELMRSSKMAMAKSGTVTLELALHECPTIVVYELTALNYFLAKYVFRINLPYYCIVNILQCKRVFPELIAEGFTSENLFTHLKSLYENGKLRDDVLRDCREVQSHLRDPFGSRNAAKAIKEALL